jgi:hypothetical protein
MRAPAHLIASPPDLGAYARNIFLRLGPNISHRAARRATIALLFAIAALAAAGCGAPGEPEPPKPVVPQPVADLAARQQGNTLILTFTLPTRSTANDDLAGYPTVEIYRGMLAAGESEHKTTTRLVYTIPADLVDTYVTGGHLEFRDPFHADDLAHEAGATMIYMVRTSVSRRHNSADSDVAEAHIFPVPDAPTALAATVTEHSIELAWQAPAGAAIAGYRVYRGELAPDSPPAETDPAKMKFISPIALAGPASETSFSDPEFDFGHTYIYIARSVAQYGPDSVESDDSAPAIVTPRDTFPPAAPRGLEAIYIPATSAAPADIELSWDISPEPDLAGYIVYRSEQPDTRGKRLNPDLLPSPSFRDIQVAADKRYFYSVSAVDRAGNESPPSSAVSAEVPANSP